MSENEPAADHPGRGQRDGRGQFIRTLDGAKRDTLAAECRAHGMPLREIAAKLGYTNESGASKAVARALAAVPVRDVGELRALECARMDALEERLWKILNTKYPLIVPGVDLVQNGEAYVEDPKPALTVIDRLLRIAERRAKLLALDAPKPREPEQPKPAALELTGQQVAMLEWLLRALPVEAGEVLTPLALTMAAETPQAKRDAEGSGEATDSSMTPPDLEESSKPVSSPPLNRLEREREAA